MLESLRIGAFPKINSLISRNERESAPDTKPNLRQELRKDIFEKSVSFKGEPKWSYDFEVKRLEGLPCACCGNKTLTKDQILDFADSIVEKKGDALAKELIKYYNYYNPTEKLVVNELIRYARVYLSCNISELVKTANQGTRAKLEDEQTEILNNIGVMGEQLTNGEKAYLQRFINKNIKTVRSREEQFKRKTFIADLESMGSASSRPDIYAEMLEEAKKLPTSRVDMGAFFIKYSKDDRSAQEIAQRLLLPRLATTEHIVPRSTNAQNKDNGELREEDNTENYIVFCSDCNRQRDVMPYPEWIEKNPNMPYSLQNYLYEVGRRIKSGELKGYDNYPQDIVNTILKVTNGAINLKLPD